jgi:hypothetical protein
VNVYCAYAPADPVELRSPFDAEPTPVECVQDPL